MAKVDRLSERTRNRELRSADWRFLLEQGELPGSTDLLALTSPSRRQLASAHAVLRPGGELYAEWTVPRPRGVHAARRRVESAGFTDVRCYWRWPPTRGRAQFWLSLDAPTVVGEHLRSRPAALVTRRHALLTALWRLARRLGLLAPVCVIARTPGPPERGFDEWMQGILGAERLSWMLLTGGGRSANKVIGLAFAGAEPSPRAAVKYARSPHEEESLLHEAETLRLVRAERPRLPGLPEILAVGQRAGRLALVQTFMPGRPLLLTLRAETFSGYADAVTEWLVALAGRAESRPRREWCERLIDGPLLRLERAFGSVIPEASLACAREILSAVESVPIVIEHRDVSPWNVLVGGSSGLSVVDWESAEPRGLAGLDLIYFLIHAGAFVDGDPHWWSAPRVYDRLLDPSTSIGSVIRRSEEHYCELVGLEHTHIGALRLLCWTLHARSEHQRLEEDDGTPPARERLDESVFIGLWRQELRRLAGRNG